jgi:hypothetical protein
MPDKPRVRKPPLKKWKIWHRAKIAKRNGDVEMLNKLAQMYAKLEEIGDAKP